MQLQKLQQWLPCLLQCPPFWARLRHGSRSLQLPREGEGGPLGVPSLRADQRRYGGHAVRSDYNVGLSEYIPGATPSCRDPCMTRVRGLVAGADCLRDNRDVRRRHTS